MPQPPVQRLRAGDEEIMQVEVSPEAAGLVLHQAQLGPVSAGRVVRPPYSPKNWAAACWMASDQVG